MGKPIAGQNQFPYVINGLQVDGANINGVLYAKKMYIYKQRSYNMYDLQDLQGNVYQFIEIGWQDVDGNELNYFDIAEELVKKIPKNTFFMKIQDPARDIFSFVRIYQWHKCITSGGDYVYRTADIDPRLAGVLINPSVSTVQLGKTASYESLFFPTTYKDRDGTWYVSPLSKNAQENISIVETDKNKSVIRGDHVGKAVLTFVPSKNDSLVTHSIVNIVDEELELKEVKIVTHSSNNQYKAGDEYVLEVVTYPYNYALTQALTVEVNDWNEDFSTELVSVSDDFKLYTFKTTYNPSTEWPYPSSNPEFLFKMTEPFDLETYMYEISIYDEEYYSHVYDQPGMIYQIPMNLRPNMTYKMKKYDNSPNPSRFPYVSSDPSIATIDADTGIVTTYGIKGTVTFTTQFEKYDGTIGEFTLYPTLTVRDEVYDSIETTPTQITQLFPGEVRQFKTIGYRDGYEPQELPFYTSTIRPESYTITSDGLLTVSDNPSIFSSTHIRHDNSISDDTQLLSNYKSSGISPRIYEEGADIPMEGLYTTTDYENRMLYIRLGGEDYDDLSSFIVYPLPYTTNNYQMKFVSYDETVIEVVEKDFVESTWQYNMGGAFYPYIKPLKRGDTQIVIQSVHSPEVTATITVVVY